MTDLNDLDRRIAALESSLAQDRSNRTQTQTQAQGPSNTHNDSSDESSASSSASNSDSLPPVYRQRKRTRSSNPDILGATFAPIAPLNPAHLPSRGASFSSNKKKQPSGLRRKSDDNFTARRCEVCPIRTVFATKDDWLRHRRDLLHRQNVVLSAGAVYEPASRKALYCRVCKVSLERCESSISGSGNEYVIYDVVGRSD